jgi:hypothetical protein
MSDASTPDRRRYRRVQAPILARPASLLARIAPRQVNDISLGGLRTYCDDPLDVGQRQEIELLFTDGASATLLVEVAWFDVLGPGAPARFEAGLRIVQARDEDLARIARVLEG